ncbi:MAG: hypothetical protein HY591_06745 [Candidatus Omnitrophica bacterium]|nr:hypothetical protein [Candidatus Omnitrophota bacterium]
MPVKVLKIRALPLATMLSCLHAVIGFVLGLIVTIASMAGTQEEEGLMHLGAWSLLLFPILNGIVGFLSGLLIAICYNFFTPSCGGIEVEVEQ